MVRSLRRYRRSLKTRSLSALEGSREDFECNPGEDGLFLRSRRGAVPLRGRWVFTHLDLGFFISGLRCFGVCSCMVWARVCSGPFILRWGFWPFFLGGFVGSRMLEVRGLALGGFGYSTKSFLRIFELYYRAINCRAVKVSVFLCVWCAFATYRQFPDKVHASSEGYRRT